jgi:hypothetical protein
MPEDNTEQLLTRIMCSPKFALEIDESADVPDLPQLLVFVRFCFEENIHGDFMFCRPLTERTTGNDMFKAANGYIASVDICWPHCVGICVDGAPALTGHKKGFQAEVRQVASHVNFIHCMVNRETLESFGLQPQLHTVL